VTRILIRRTGSEIIPEGIVEEKWLSMSCGVWRKPRT
jgi:hypothetical protein